MNSVYGSSMISLQVYLFSVCGLINNAHWVLQVADELVAEFTNPDSPHVSPDQVCPFSIELYFEMVMLGFNSYAISLFLSSCSVLVLILLLNQLSLQAFIEIILYISLRNAIFWSNLH